MYSYIRGELVEIGEDLAVVEAGGIGYNLRIPGKMTDHLPPVGELVKIYTYLYVREDAMLLYGFLTKDDLNVFKMLLGVSGIGPKGALSILSAMSCDDLRFAILSDDVKTISQANGIGKKTAQRLIIELKDKLSLEDAFEQKFANEAAVSVSTSSTAKDDAVMALNALGYSAAEALAAVRKVEITEEMDSDDVLKAALKHLL
jgi:Holliday junction DNA helicase RuvA